MILLTDCWSAVRSPEQRDKDFKAYQDSVAEATKFYKAKL